MKLIKIKPIKEQLESCDWIEIEDTKVIHIVHETSDCEFTLCGFDYAQTNYDKVEEIKPLCKDCLKEIIYFRILIKEFKKVKRKLNEVN